MVVDDNPILAHAIARTLAEHDVSVETDATAALAQIVDAEVDGAPFDIVVCDARMPRKTGLEILEATRALYRPPLFVLISGEADIADAGADAVLLKPFTPRELRALVTCLLSARASHPTRRMRVLPG